MAEEPSKEPSKVAVKCKVPLCDRPAKSKGWCQSHYARYFRTGSVGTAPIGQGNMGRPRGGVGNKRRAGRRSKLADADRRFRAACVLEGLTEAQGLSVAASKWADIILKESN